MKLLAPILAGQETQEAELWHAASLFFFFGLGSQPTRMVLSTFRVGFNECFLETRPTRTWKCVSLKTYAFIFLKKYLLHLSIYLFVLCGHVDVWWSEGNF